jgi:hypothetical protein
MININFPSIFVSTDPNIEDLNRTTTEWTMRAARKECIWVCSDCCSVFPSGMPDSCAHDIRGCTDIIQRDKKEAYDQV